MLMNRSVRAAAGLIAVPEHISHNLLFCFLPYWQGRARPGPGAADVQTGFTAELLGSSVNDAELSSGQPFSGTMDA